MYNLVLQFAHDEEDETMCVIYMLSSSLNNITISKYIMEYIFSCCHIVNVLFM